MHARFVRVLIVVASVAALVAGGAPPVAAFTGASLTLAGNISISGGMGYPCTPIGSTFDCPPTVGVAVAPEPDGLPGVAISPSGPSRSFAMGSKSCVGQEDTVAKPGKLPTSVGLCSLQAAGSLTGRCGLARGAANGTATLAAILAFQQGFTFTVRITWIGTFWYLAGAVVKTNTGESGTLRGTLRVVPDPVAGSCATGTATHFTFVGEVDIVIL